MVLFFTRSKVDSDSLIKYAYDRYRLLIDRTLPREVEIVREDGKKPRLKGNVAYFNLSHTDGLTVIAVSHSEIGVDVEKIRDIDFKKFDFISANDKKEFFKEWTRRESCVKLSGVGISGIRKEVPCDVHIETFTVYDEYELSVAAEQQNISLYDVTGKV